MPPRRRPSSPIPPPRLPKKPNHHADGVPDSAFERCRKLLNTLLMHKDAIADLFDKPVDSRELGIPDYYAEISNCMDLGTVGRRLERGRFANPLAFAEDVRLVFRNALAYNYEGDYAYESAILLSGIFESGWASILAERPSPPVPVPSVAERWVRLQDELPRLPADVQLRAAVIMNEIGGRLQMVDGKVLVDFSQADEATLDRFERLVAENKAVLAGVAGR